MTTFESIKGKVAIVTGSTSGIGEAIAKCLAENGAKVVVSGRNEEKGHKIVDEIQRNGGTAVFFKGDISNEETVSSLISYAVDTFGALHIMVNNAGSALPNHPIHDFSTEEFNKAMTVLTSSVFWGIKYAVKAMINSNSRDCSIINIASDAGLSASEGNGIYTTGKHAVVGLTKNAALDYVKHDITVNAICPGTVKTSIFNGVSAEQLAIFESYTPAGRFAEPIEIAYLALFLASDMARYITGAAIPVDGGFIAGGQNPASEWIFKDTRQL